MVGIEARRFAKHPLFIIGTLATFVVTGLLYLGDDAYASDMLIQPVAPAFFIGVFSLVVAARLVRSTEAADEALGAAPGTEARRTLAVAGACLVPFAVGLVWLATVFALLSYKEPHPSEWWFNNMSDLQVWSILIALGPVACLGGGLLGVLVGRWLRFRGAPAVAVVALLFGDIAGHGGFTSGEWASYGDSGEFRLWLPWAMFHSGNYGSGDLSESAIELGIQKGTALLLPGNAAFYLLYVLVLCALAVGGAVWHDRTARTTALRLRLWGLIAVAGVLLALAILTGPDALRISTPQQWMLGG